MKDARPSLIFVHARRIAPHFTSFRGIYEAEHPTDVQAAFNRQSFKERAPRNSEASFGVDRVGVSFTPKRLSRLLPRSRLFSPSFHTFTLRSKYGAKVRGTAETTA